MNRLTNTASRDGVDSRTGNTETVGAPILDRSRSHLRLPVEMVTEAMRIAHVQSIPNVDSISTPEPPSKETADRLEASGVMAEGLLDPIAFELLDVVNQASLVVSVDLHYMDDSAMPTVWATPRRAVVSSSIDPDYIEFRPVPVNQLPQVLAELIVLRSPQFIGDVPISISEQILHKAKELNDRDKALAMLGEGGLDPDQAVLALDLQRHDVRRWWITSTWSTDDGQETTELQGLDAGPSGQWLVEATRPEDDATQLTFSPQGHGETMSAFRTVLPKNWMGTPLNRPT